MVILQVINRNGHVEKFDQLKIANRIIKLAKHIDCDINNWQDRVNKLTIEIIDKIKVNIISTKEIDEISADITYSHKYEDNVYNTLASYIMIDNIQKSGPQSFANAMAVLYFNDWAYAKTHFIPHPDEERLNGKEPLINRDLYNFVYEFRAYFLNRDMQLSNTIISYSGCKKLQKSYLMTIIDDEGNKQIVETPQYLFLRIACALVCRNKYSENDSYIRSMVKFDKYNYAIRLYDDMYKNGIFSFATPALMHAGSYKYENYISCFLIMNKEDSIDGFYQTLRNMAMIAKLSGGIGVYMNNMRAQGSLIKSSNTNAAGLLPVFGLMNASSLYVNQGSEKRPGSVSPYIEVWHADIESILENSHPDANKLKVPINNLFPAIMLNDYFFECVKNKLPWYLFSPDTAPKLITTYGEEFKQTFQEYYLAGKSVKSIDANKLFGEIIRCKLEFSRPYLLNKCTINKLSMYQGYCKMMNIPILMSNLCVEIVEFTSADETACCTLASINLGKMFISGTNFIDRFGFNEDNMILDGTSLFNFELFRTTIHRAIYYLDTIIDINTYPSPETIKSNMRHRPLGLGVRGMADLFMQLMIPFTSKIALILNRSIFRHMYYYALEASCELAKERGKFEYYELSPYNQGKLHCDLYDDLYLSKNGKRILDYAQFDEEDRLINAPILDWTLLRDNINTYGVRNIQLIALMPTKSMAKITDSSESFNPVPYLIYRDKSSSGDVNEINKYLIDELKRRNLYSQEILNNIIRNQSIKDIVSLPLYFRKCFYTAFEYSQKDLINMAIDRTPWVDQSQSFNQFFKLENLRYDHFYTAMIMEDTGLMKTLSYYLERPPATKSTSMVIKSCSDDVCESCTA